MLKSNRLRRLAMVMLLALSIPTGSACSGPQETTEKAPEAQLKEAVVEYNRLMKWGMYEQAADFVDVTYREAFLGRYEEKGEDFKIVGLEIKGVTYIGSSAVVETEQEWYDESMVVDKDRFMEIWGLKAGVWTRGERMTKKEYRKRKKELFPTDTSEEKETQTPDTTAEKAETPSGTPETPAPDTQVTP